MIDTLMAIWNRGYGGRGVLVSLAFLLICISISLLLVTVGNFWTALWMHPAPRVTKSDTLSTSLTATAQSQWRGATPGGTPLVYPPTLTPTINACALTSTTGRASHLQFSPTAQHKPGGHSATPTLTPHPRPTATATATPHPRPTNTPVPTATATATSTPTPTPTPTVTPTPSPTLTPTSTATPTTTATPAPSPTPVATNTATPMPTVTPTATVTPTVSATPTIPPRRRGGTPVATPSVSATEGHNKTAGSSNCSSIYSGSSDSVGQTLNGSVGAILLRNLWVILGGSTVGTILFYITLYLLNRKRNIQGEVEGANNEIREQ